jgi:hypothetical protein
MYIVKSNFTNGESPKALGDRGYVWVAGSIYSGDQADFLLSKGLVEEIPGGEKAHESDESGEVALAPGSGSEEEGVSDPLPHSSVKSKGKKKG